MPNLRVPMVQIKQILRLRSQCSLSLNKIARTLHLSKGVVAKYVKLAQLAGLIWDDAKHLDDAALHQKLRSKRPQNAVPITALDDSTNDHPNSVDSVNAASAKLAANAPPTASPTAESPFYPLILHGCIITFITITSTSTITITQAPLRLHPLLHRLSCVGKDG